MRSFDQGIRDLLLGALISRAHIRGYQLEDTAADFIVRRAISNINSKNFSDIAKLAAALKAINNVDSFFDRIAKSTSERKFLVESSVQGLIRNLTVDCIYPWCTDQP